MSSKNGCSSVVLMMFPMFSRSRTTAQQLGSSRCSRSSRHLRSAILAGLCLAAFKVHSAEEPKTTTTQAQEGAPIANPDKIAPDKAAPDKRPPSTPTVLKEASTPSKVLRYSQYLLNLYDTDRDGVLQKSEWKLMHGKPELIDTNGDGDISVEEMTRWVTGYGRRKQSGNIAPTETAIPESTPPTSKPSATPEADAPPQSASTSNGERLVDRAKETKYYVSPKRLPAGLPEWFVQRDLDGDGQLTFSEYSPNSVAAELVEFEGYDANGDGVVTAKECTQKNSDKAASKDSNDSRANSSVTKQSRNKRKTKEPQQ